MLSTAAAAGSDLPRDVYLPVVYSTSFPAGWLGICARFGFLRSARRIRSPFIFTIAVCCASLGAHGNSALEDMVDSVRVGANRLTHAMRT